MVNAPSPERQKWEYKIRKLMTTVTEINEEMLAAQGVKGWELAGIAPNGYAIFKRSL